MLCWCNDYYRALPSEGGHVDFAPTTETERELLYYLLRDKQRVSYEDLLSGSGLYRLYGFLRDNKHGEESRAMTTALRGDSDPAAIITEYALEHADPLANQALDLFISIYGAQAGNLALTTRAHGGLYICGGIAPRIIDRIRAGGFMDAFVNKAPMTSLMESIPVRVIMNTQVGLLGAAMFAARSGSSAD
jgi:glucokinase